MGTRPNTHTHRSEFADISGLIQDLLLTLGTISEHRANKTVIALIIPTVFINFVEIWFDFSTTASYLYTTVLQQTGLPL